MKAKSEFKETKPNPADTELNNPVNSLKILQVIDSLEVGPVKLEPRRLIAPYTVSTAGNSVTQELIYTYEEAVFQPAEAASQNLAAMVAAQVALNYGLFCRKIVFHGIYDDADRRFILDMMENTSREIYLKKFLEHLNCLRST